MTFLYENEQSMHFSKLNESKVVVILHSIIPFLFLYCLSRVHSIRRSNRFSLPIFGSPVYAISMRRENSSHGFPISVQKIIFLCEFLIAHRHIHPITHTNEQTNTNSNTNYSHLLKFPPSQPPSTSIE